MEQAGTAANHPQADAVALRDRAIVEMLVRRWGTRL